jgi:hypothetical protein
LVKSHAATRLASEVMAALALQVVRGAAAEAKMRCWRCAGRWLMVVELLTLPKDRIVLL